jgi:S1-C subfamily serine protease
MPTGVRSHLAASIIGGLVVAGGLLALGATGRRTVQTVIDQAPVATERVAGRSAGLTPHAIYQRESPAVVHISARLLEPHTSPFDVLHEAETGVLTGSGFLVDRRGDVMTAYHLIDGASRSDGITVGFEGGVQRTASVLATDPAQDVAVLRVDLHGVPAVGPLPLGNSSSVRIGDPTLAIGNPYGVDRTLTSGIVSSLEHVLIGEDGVSVDNVIQTDEPVDPASSGAPLLDAAGRVIGVDSELIGPEGTTQAFASPVDAIAPMLRGVQRVTRVSVAYLGLSGVAAPGAHPAVTITGVTPGSPAEKAGLRRGDAIDRLGGVTVSSLPALSRLISTSSPGQRVTIEISRHGRLRTLVARLGSRG